MPRKVAFSGKQKREQLLKKRQRKQGVDVAPTMGYRKLGLASSDNESEPEEAPVAESKPTTTSKGLVKSHSELVSVFTKLTPKEIQQNKERAMQPFLRLPKAGLEISVEEMYPDTIDIPQRPPWKPTDSKVVLDRSEQQYLDQWLHNIEESYDPSQLSFFERNLEVWRQLWRVAEISDVVLLITDIRHPLLHFPPSVYRYVVHHLKKPLVLVLNKIDLVAQSTVDAWKAYLKAQFPELAMTTFACYEAPVVLLDDTNVCDMRLQVKRPRKRAYRPVGAADLFRACQKLDIEKPGVNVDWAALISRYEYESDDGNGLGTTSNTAPQHSGNASSETPIRSELEQEITYNQNYLTLGLIGHPNVGKSTLINSLMGRTVVSASKTPGHTKRFQTIYLADNVRLCDCPGLVFPSLTPKPVQILTGLFNIAQVQEPYSSVQYLAERIPLERVLKLTAPDDILAPGQKYWTAWAICESHAIRKRFFTAKAQRPDAYRSANAILRLVVDGRVLLSFKPPNFFRRASDRTGAPHPVPLVYVRPELDSPAEESDTQEVSDAYLEHESDSEVESEDEEEGEVDDDHEEEGEEVEEDGGEDSEANENIGKSSKKKGKARAGRGMANAFSLLDMDDC
ncbi:hypothetical protein H4R33_000486 [Dimargaris cristalligena]|uniref:Guanine nucleotide-binding protein-like 1 n=1 Tax=Dimargaris cristalligena TaxID=215637 RepID=A0A4P9ZWT4_9FUNG|nr:hypothetical protein H4R33_000486 [Dimargaris cristalligena]RKP37431.1 hypothetical protein BJ085DRAFT_40191 [Dimargaris cristalligena]|eukprot:RKP37431.1 hypothetical protein BJ085DRAFT_40191 [Dimargaris cristalligena]